MKIIKLISLLILGSVLMSGKCSGITKIAKKASPPPSVVKKADDVEVKKVPQGPASDPSPTHILKARRLLKDSTSKNH